jgi:SAM-dependent methyltransferase
MTNGSTEPSQEERSRYLLGDSAEELDHLVAQAEVFAEEAAQLLDRLPVGSGGAVIDVGCGVLGVLHLLRQRVGPSGRVVGVDREPRMVAMARRIISERRIEVELIEGDAPKLMLPSDSFDLVHERTVLLNVADPEQVLAEMFRIARAGGIVAVQEPDSAGWVCDPPHPAWDALRTELLRAYLMSGKNFDWGRTAARLLRQVGLRDVQVRVPARSTKPGDYYHTLLALTGLVRDQILATGNLRAASLMTFRVSSVNTSNRATHSPASRRCGRPGESNDDRSPRKPHCSSRGVIVRTNAADVSAAGSGRVHPGLVADGHVPAGTWAGTSAARRPSMM